MKFRIQKFLNPQSLVVNYEVWVKRGFFGKWRYATVYNTKEQAEQYIKHYVDGFSDKKRYNTKVWQYNKSGSFQKELRFTKPKLRKT